MVGAAIQPVESSNPTAFFESLKQTFNLATESSDGTIDRSYHIGPSTVHFQFAGPELMPRILPAVAHLECAGIPEPALRVRLFDTHSTHTQMPPPPWTRDCYGPRGEIRGYNTRNFHVIYGPGTDILYALDRENSSAYYWVPNASAIPYWETSFPLRTMFHWWFRDQPCQPVHAGAVGMLEGGVLIGGRSGSGKSTATLACLESDLLFAGDDYVLAEADPRPYVYSLYCTAKLERHHLRRLPHLEPLVTNATRPEEEKALIYLSKRYPEKLTHGFPIRAIFLPRVTGLRDTRLVECGRAASLKALAPTTVIHLQGAADQTMSKLASLARCVPSFYLEMGTDLAQIPAVISTFLREHRA